MQWRISEGLSHPYILPLLNSGQADGLLYYVMPFMEGENLRERLAREPRLPIEDALRIADEMAEALGHAHALGIVHRNGCVGRHARLHESAAGGGGRAHRRGQRPIQPRRLLSDSAGLPLLAIDLLHALCLGLDLAGDEACRWPEQSRTMDQTFPGGLPATFTAELADRRVSRLRLRGGAASRGHTL